MSRTLCRRKSKFIREYTRHKDAVRAAVAAGYSPRLAEQRAAQLLDDPQVRDRLERSLSHDTNDHQLTRKAVLNGLLREAGDHSGNSSPANRLKAWELVCKLMGFFNDTKDGSLPTVVYDIRIDGQATGHGTDSAK